MKYKFYLAIIFFLLLILSTLFWSGQREIERRKPELAGKTSLVKKLQLTDFAIWTEARYTRHPSQADLFTPFQDFPSSMEHFPAGSIMAPPPRRGTTTIEFRKKIRNQKDVLVNKSR